jgi:site-specific recombinase XerD
MIGAVPVDGDLIAAFIHSAAGRGLSAGTLQKYERALQRFVQWRRHPGSDLPMATAAEIGQYRSYLKVDCGLSAATVNLNLAAVKAFYNWYGRENSLPEAMNPGKQIGMVRGAQNLPESLLPEELAAMEAAVQNPLQSTILAVLESTGVRASELLGLKVTDISFERAEIKVTGKGRKQRLIPLTVYCGNCLRNWLQYREKLHPDSNAVFVDLRGGAALNYNQLYYLIRKLSAKGTHPHALRHTVATKLIAGGATIKEVQELLGHSDIKTTARYLHPGKDYRKKHEEILGRGE